MSSTSIRSNIYTSTVPSMHIYVQVYRGGSKEKRLMSIEVSPQGTILMVKQKIQVQHPVHPDPSEQRITFSGRERKDDVQLNSISTLQQEGTFILNIESSGATDLDPAEVEHFILETLLVDTNDHGRIEVEVHGKTTILEVKQKINLQLNGILPVDSQVVVVNGRVMTQNDVTCNQVLPSMIQRNKFLISVETIDGPSCIHVESWLIGYVRQIPLWVNNDDDVSAVKAALHAVEGVSPEEQVLLLHATSGNPGRPIFLDQTVVSPGVVYGGAAGARRAIVAHGRCAKILLNEQGDGKGTVVEEKEEGTNTPIQIVLKTLVGKNIPLNVKPTDSIDLVKEMIRTKEGIPRWQQRILYGGVQFENDKTLPDYGILPGAAEPVTLHLVVRA